MKFLSFFCFLLACLFVPTGTLVKTVSVSQPAAPSTSNRNSRVSPNGGIASYSVDESAYAWNASTAADWVTIVNNTGIEGDSVVYVAKPNTTGATRTATILTTCGSVSAGANNTNTVTQEAGSSGLVAATLDVDTTTWSISSSAADSKMITITANSAWEISSNADWISFSQTSGTGTGTVTISANANAGTLARTGTVTISAGEISRTISVAQAGVEEVSDDPIATYISLGTSSYDFTSAKAQSKGNNAVWCDGTWIATSNNEWLTISLNTESIGQTSITSTKTESIKFYVTENTGAARTGTITITMPNSSVPSRTITITQVAGAIIPEPPEEEAGIDRWVYGITPPTLLKSANGDYAIWSEGCGWYDADKVSMTADVGNDSNLCWAATCANLLHWWFDRNAENITRYGKYTGPENTYRNCFPTQTQATAAVNMSSFFDWYKNNGYGNSGNNVRVGIEHFLSVKPGSISGNERNGAYLADVFPPDDTNYFVEYVSNAGNTQSTAGMSPELLASTMKRVFAGEIAVGMSYQINGSGHAVTVWGARFDAENNYVTHLFVADNNADYDGGDLNATKIIVSDGMVYLGSTNFKINYLSLLRTGDEEWATYFNDFDEYDSWAEGKGLTITNAELGASPAGDGKTNLEKFVFDAAGTIDPTKPSGGFGTAGIVAENEGTPTEKDFLQVEFPFNRDADGVVELEAQCLADPTSSTPTWTNSGITLTKDAESGTITLKLNKAINESDAPTKQAVRLRGTLAGVSFETVPYGYSKISLAPSTKTILGLQVHHPHIFVKDIPSGGVSPFVVAGTKISINNADFAWKLDPAKSYIVEILTGSEGNRVSAPFIINRSAWRNDRDMSIAGTTVSFESPELVSYLTSGVSPVAYRVRPAITLQDVFGTPSESGMKPGNAGTADTLMFKVGSSVSVKFFVNRAGAWSGGVALVEDGAIASEAPIFTHDAIVVTRKAGETLTYVVSGEVLTDNQRVQLGKGYNYAASGLLFSSDSEEAALQNKKDSETHSDVESSLR